MKAERLRELQALRAIPSVPITEAVQEDERRTGGRLRHGDVGHEAH